MATLFSTGPANLYISAPTINVSYGMNDLLTYPDSADVFFLGTCETAPAINIEPSFMPIKADIGGPMLPFDHLFVGEIGVVSGVLNKWNEAVYTKLTARPNQVGGTRGTYTSKGIGNPMMLRGPGSAFCLWVQFPYQGKSFYSTQPAGYRFPGAILFGPDIIQPGTPSRRALTFWGGRVYKSTDGTWKVYDHTMTNIPTVPPIVATGAIV